ncbi:MAG TPA: hypothetical protein VK902_20520 [Rubrobacter sp.]|nr:hypothetical protein [Rubrobacter sp.]
MSHRAAWLAWSACGLTVVLIACAVALAVLSRSDIASVSFPLGLLVSAMVGGLVASRRPENPVGWIFLASGGVSPSRRSRQSTPPTGYLEPRR